MRKNLLLLFVPALLFFPARDARSENNWSLTLYGGQVNFESFVETVGFQTDLRDSHLVALAVAKKIAAFGQGAQWEIEGNIVQHSGMQDHFEFNALLFLRQHQFPWNKYLNTTMAIGFGPSYATEIPTVESIQLNKTSQILNCVILEFTLAHPKKFPQWDFVTRIHHRSGVNGIINGVWGGSNFICVGVKKRF